MRNDSFWSYTSAVILAILFGFSLAQVSLKGVERLSGFIPAIEETFAFIWSDFLDIGLANIGVIQYESQNNLAKLNIISNTELNLVAEETEIDDSIISEFGIFNDTVTLLFVGDIMLDRGG